MVGHNYPKAQQCEGCIAFILWLTLLLPVLNLLSFSSLTHQQLYSILAKALNAFFKDK